MAEARRITRSELFAHFAERCGIKSAEADEFFDELRQVTERELLLCRKFVVPVVAKLEVADKNLMRNYLGTLPLADCQSYRTRSHLEATGLLAALRAGIAFSSAQRPLERNGLRYGRLAAAVRPRGLPAALETD